MRIIGITGGVGCGKSAVMQYLEEQTSGVILKTDDLAKELMEPGQPAYQPVRTLFGEASVCADGTFNRPYLASVIFSDPEKLKQMNAIVHPLVKQAVRERIARESASAVSFFFLESALLLEENYNEICDELWYVYAEEKVRRLRLAESRGYSEEKMDAMMKNQAAEEVFREACQFVIDNSGSFAQTCAQIDARLREYKEV